MLALIDFIRQAEDCRADLETAFARVLKSGWFVLGREVEEFERALAAEWGVRHACGVASGQDALEIGLRVLGCGRGDRVLTTPLSAFATTLAIVKLGAVPVFVDTDASGLIDLDLCRKALRSQGDIRFFVPVHLYGHGLRKNELLSLRDEFGLLMVEDCAQSIGVSEPFGQVAATSFYPTKNLGALGDGGALLTHDPVLDQAARVLRDYGQSAKYRHDQIGYNSRLDELQAAFLRSAFLPRLDGWLKRRKAIAERYLDQIRHPGIRPLVTSRSNWHLFPVLVVDKPRFIEHMSAMGIGTGEHYPILIPDQKAMADVPHELIGDLMNARAIAQGEVSLPIHPYLTDEEVGRVIAAATAFPKTRS